MSLTPKQMLGTSHTANIWWVFSFHLLMSVLGWQRIQGLNDDNSKIAAWKFNSMDTNGDKELSRHELKELKRDVRKNIKPKVGCRIVKGPYLSSRSVALTV